MALLGVAELNANLKLIKDWTAVELVKGMEISLNKIVTTAKSNHERAKSLSPSELKLHPSDRYYTHTGKLTGSIHAEKVQATLTGISGAVVASEAYAAKVELGGPNRRAFPFMQPALVGNEQAFIYIMTNHIRMVIK